MLARRASKVLIIDFWIADEASPRGSESPDLLPCSTNSPLSGCLCLPRLLFNGTLKTELRHRKTMLGSLGEQLQRFRHGLVHAIACLVAPPEAVLPIHVPLLCKLGESLHHLPKILGHPLTALLTARQVNTPLHCLSDILVNPAANIEANRKIELRCCVGLLNCLCIPLYSLFPILGFFFSAPGRTEGPLPSNIPALMLRLGPLS